MMDETGAAAFERRALPPIGQWAEIAGRVGEMAGIHPGQRWLEVGPGTGALSIELLRKGIRYVGIDRSSAMLVRFSKSSRREERPPLLLRADAAGIWPVKDGFFHVVLAIRAAHRLPSAHMVRETVRVTDPSRACLLLASLGRDASSVRSEIRRRMHRVMRARGLAPRDHEQQEVEVIGRLLDEGWRLASPSPQVLSRWTREVSPAIALRDWSLADGIGGLAVEGDVKHAILDDLRAWAAERYGDVDAMTAHEEWLEMYSVLRES